ncbi:hypothetical protein D8S82_13325 [Mycobacterium hodleri]|uniref:Lipoprotein n=1 Tax=Mycolicibacterium hodleri TaxID=49897 RepID=A0A544W1A2_9MYCO|nr:hypothetical protein [Mycolicibacterium hodleri]TQR86028.1 hypothetical protein D8S82_13325 [Mycolicibacterium hodleri]
MRSSRNRWQLIATFVTAGAVIVGCTSKTEPSPVSPTTPASAQIPNWPDSLGDFRFHWAAAPGIDLTTGPAVPLRAYLESYDLVDYTGDMSAVYPGFLRATPENGPQQTPGYPIELGSIRPEVDAKPSATAGSSAHPGLYGYAPFYVSSIEPIGDAYRAFVCTSEYSVFKRDANDESRYVSIITRSDSAPPPNADRYGIIVWRVEFTKNDSRVPPNGPAEPLEPQRGPAPAPTRDVFGPWFVTAASYTLWGNMGDAQDVGPPELQQQCADNMPDDAAARRAMYTGAHDAPPPHGDAIPGWPAEPK